MEKKTLAGPLGRELARQMLARRQRSKVTDVLRSCILDIEGPPLGVSWYSDRITPPALVLPLRNRTSLERGPSMLGAERQPSSLVQPAWPTKSLYEHPAGCCLAQRGGVGWCSTSSEWKE